MTVTEFYKLTPYLTSLVIEADHNRRKQTEEAQKYCAWITGAMAATGWQPDFDAFMGREREVLPAESLENRMVAKMTAHNSSVKGKKTDE